MKATNRLFFITALLCGIVATAQADVSRERFNCELQQSDAVQGYTRYKFYGFIYPESQNVNLEYSLVDSQGKIMAQGELKSAYTIQNDSIVLAIARPDGVKSRLAISKNLLSLPLANVAGAFDDKMLNCSLSETQLLSDGLPQKEFAKYNLPVTSEGLLKEKTWTSSDGVFSLKLSLVEDYVNKHGVPVKGWSDLEVSFLGAVIDGAEDVPRYMGYLQYGEEKRTIRATLTQLVDVKKVISIFKSDKISLNLFHPYGQTSPVNLQIDCTSGRSCVITSQN